ncbi:MAG: hypothetical protein HOY76_18535 [Streptomyces sp.]|nr:hypothetical protein [Streptomyces sp.]NUS16477.1 hypothetical protein [Streptomyces sp.]
MKRIKCRLPRSPRFRRRLVMSVLALIIALPLLAEPELWQYLTAAILVHDAILRLNGGENGDPDRVAENRRPRVEGGTRNDGTDGSAEPDTVRATGHRP